VIDAGITIELDCGCIFSEDDVFRNHPITMGSGCRKGAHSTFEADAIPVVAMAQGDGPLPERFFAVAKPGARAIAIFFDHGHVDITLEEARLLHRVIGGAIEIYDGMHPVQREGQ
jgi:hypothetical protein